MLVPKSSITRLEGLGETGVGIGSTTKITLSCFPVPWQGSPNTSFVASMDSESLLMAASTIATELAAWQDPT